MTDLLQHAERVEAATGNDRGLFEAAFIASFGKADERRKDAADWIGKWQRFSRLLDVGAYLDAAMMLVPEGWVINLRVYHDCASVTLEDDSICPVRLAAVEVDANTSALAICAAALRARAATPKDMIHEGEG